MTSTNPDLETQVLARLTQIEQDLELVKTDLGLIKEESKGWTTWLRTSTTVLLFGVALTLLALVLPIGFALWRDTLAPHSPDQRQPHEFRHRRY